MLRDREDDRPSELPLPAAVAVPFAPARPNQSISNDLLDDVFGSSPGDDDDRPGTDLSAASPHEVSDIPRLRSTHVTAGYRDGIAESKAKYVQEGFDEGYSLGAVIGLRVGWILGVLGGMTAALNQKSKTATNAPGGSGNTSSLEKGKGKGRDGTTEANPDQHTAVKDLLTQAKDDLNTQGIFARDYFDEEGVWKYEVPGDEGEVTFEHVADAHPLVRKWGRTVKELAREVSVNLETLERNSGRHIDAPVGD